jgi:hypothetical protein
MDKNYKIFLQLLRARQHGDPVVTSHLSISLALRCLRAMGGKQAGIAIQSSRDDVPPGLLHIVTANGWAFLILDLLWVSGGRVLSDGVLLVPGLTDTQAIELAPYAETVKQVYLQTDDDLAEALYALRPGDHLAEVDLQPQNFLEAVTRIIS